MVAQLRGAKFELRGRRMLPIRDGESCDIADDALIEMIYWLGFGSFSQYLRALGRLKQSIFSRAKD